MEIPMLRRNYSSSTDITFDVLLEYDSMTQCSEESKTAWISIKVSWLTSL